MKKNEEYSGPGACLKKTVVAIIENRGRYWVGTNWCMKPQVECPRKDMPSGTGYEKCKDICAQRSHAEVDACEQAGHYTKGATLYLIGHTYCCDNCKKIMKQYGIKSVVIGQYPPRWRDK